MKIIATFLFLLSTIAPLYSEETTSSAESAESADRNKGENGYILKAVRSLEDNILPVMKKRFRKALNREGRAPDDKKFNKLENDFKKNIKNLNGAPMQKNENRGLVEGFRRSLEEKLLKLLDSSSVKKGEDRSSIKSLVDKVSKNIMNSLDSSLDDSTTSKKTNTVDNLRRKISLTLQEHLDILHEDGNQKKGLMNSAQNRLMKKVVTKIQTTVDSSEGLTKNASSMTEKITDKIIGLLEGSIKRAQKNEKGISFLAGKLSKKILTVLEEATEGNRKNERETPRIKKSITRKLRTSLQRTKKSENIEKTPTGPVGRMMNSISNGLRVIMGTNIKDIEE